MSWHIRASRWLLVAFVVGGSLMVACGNSAPPPPPPGGPPPVRPLVASAKVSASASDSAQVSSFIEADFTESDSSRDPFRNFNRMFAPSATVIARPQYSVELEQYTIEQLKLVAIVIAGDGGRAMFVDPKGKGWVFHRGTYLGRGDVIRPPGSQGPGTPVHWRIDRVKPGEVVLIKQSPLHPEVPATYREIPLHQDAEKT